MNQKGIAIFIICLISAALSLGVMELDRAINARELPIKPQIYVREVVITPEKDKGWK